MKQQRATRQLAAVYDALAASHDHPTADQIFRRVRGVLPHVSLGTVYRNLDKLREQGRLRVVRLEGGQAHYDAVTEAHDHFVCERCGGVVDLPGSNLQPLDVPTLPAGYEVRWHTTALYGVCQHCSSSRGKVPTVTARRRRRRSTAIQAI